jgi:hypothetical protein
MVISIMDLDMKTLAGRFSISTNNHQIAPHLINLNVSLVIAEITFSAKSGSKLFAAHKYLLSNLYAVNGVMLLRKRAARAITEYQHPDICETPVDLGALGINLDNIPNG